MRDVGILNQVVKDAGATLLSLQCLELTQSPLLNYHDCILYLFSKPLSVVTLLFSLKKILLVPSVDLGLVVIKFFSFFLSWNGSFSFGSVINWWGDQLLSGGPAFIYDLASLVLFNVLSSFCAFSVLTMKKTWKPL